MDYLKIEHSYLNINGLSLHIAHIGDATKGTVVFLHGFPEIWYTWQHQMLAVAKGGYRAIVPDSRGYGLPEQPKQPDTVEWEDFTDDLVSILDTFKIPKVFNVGKDSGAITAYDFAVYHSNRVCAQVGGKRWWTRARIEVRAMLIMGEKDYCFKFPGIKETVRSGMANKYVPKLEVKFMEQGSHFVQEHFPEEVNDLVLGLVC